MMEKSQNKFRETLSWPMHPCYTYTSKLVLLQEKPIFSDHVFAYVVAIQVSIRIKRYHEVSEHGSKNLMMSFVKTFTGTKKSCLKNGLKIAMPTFLSLPFQTIYALRQKFGLKKKSYAGLTTACKAKNDCCHTRHLVFCLPLSPHIFKYTMNKKIKRELTFLNYQFILRVSVFLVFLL